MEKNILVYNNHTGVVEAMEPLFAGEGYHSIVVTRGEDIERLLKEKRIYLLLTDIELKDRDGIEVLRNIRKKNRLPIIVLSKKADEQSKIEALNAGADDYVTYPCNTMELLARIKSQIRRYTQLINLNSSTSDICYISGLELDDRRRIVTVESREVKLTPIEYKILKLLIQERGRVVSVQKIYESIWNMQAFGADNTIAVHIRHIREKIEKNPKEPEYLKVVWGTGYKVG